MTRIMEEGQRAPPRNKMAIYEQFSIPSQKLTMVSTSSMASFPATSVNTWGSSMSSNHSGDHQKSTFTPLSNSPAQPCSHLYGSSGVKFSTKTTSKEWKSTKPTIYPTLGNIGPLPATATPICNFSNFKDFYLKTDIDKDNHRFTSLQPDIPPYCGDLQHGNDWESYPRLNLNYPMHLQTTSEKQIKDVEEVFRIISPENVKLLGLGPSKVSNNIITTTTLMRPQTSLNELNKGSLVNNLENGKSTPHQERQDETPLRMESANGNVRKEPSYKAGQSVGDNNLTLNGSCNDCYEDKSPIKVKYSHRHSRISDMSWVHSRSVSPDVVVGGVLGENEYWNARSTIANQQRVFALQVFELHRLIQVQKIIAGSPRLFIEQNFLVGKLVRTKKFSSESIQELSPVNLKDHIQKSNCVDENTSPKIPLPPMNNSKEFVTQPTNYEAKPSPWCFMPPGNQWLVPVMSPSEGFIYKPYTEPCPPPSSVYGSYPPINPTPPPGGDFLSTTYGVLASHKQNTGVFPSWGPQYGTPLVKSTNSVPLVDQVGQFPGARARDDEFLAGEVDFSRPLQNFGNRGRIGSCYFGKFPENEVASISCQKNTRDELQLFPTELTVHASDIQNSQTNSKQPQQVFKVIPHNPRSASESAARIFQSIQEQRKGL